MSGQDKNDGWETVTDEKTVAAVKKKGGNGNVVLTGDDYLATLDPARAALVKAIAEGRRAAPNGMALRTPYGQQLIQDVYQYDNTADDANLPGRVSARKAFTSGVQGRNYLSIATALDHTSNLDDAITRLGNGRSPIPGTTRIVNGIKTAFMDADGDPRITAFNDTVTPLVDELERAYVGAGGNVADVKRLHDGISPSQSMDQQRTAVQTFARLLSGKLDELNKSYNLAMGTTGQTAPGMTDNARRLLAAYTNPDYVAKGLAGTYAPNDETPGGPTGGAPGGTPPTGGTPSSGPISPFFKTLNDAPAPTNAQGQPIISPDFTSTVDTAAKARNQQVLAAVSAGKSDDEVLSIAANLGVDPATSGLSRILAYRKKTGLTNFADTTDYNVRRPTNLGERLVNTFVSDPRTTFATEGANAFAGGLPFTLARAVGGENVRNGLDAARNTNPRTAVAGQLVGTALGAAGAEGLATKGLLKLGKTAETAAKVAPRIGDATFGAISGATGDPEHPIMGALKGTFASLGGGEVGRGLAVTTAGALAPTGGNTAPLYEAGVRPSLGQRVVNGGTDGSLKRVAGQVINGTEEAAQSVPGVGFLIKGTRQRARNQFQTGGFNDALGDIGLELPKDAPRGTAAFQFMDNAHSEAYGDVLPRMNAVADPQAIADTQAIVSSANNGGLAADSAARFGKIIDDQVTRRMTGPNLSGENLKDALAGIGQQIRTLRNSPQGDGELADFLENYAQVIKESAARNSAPEDAARLADIDRSYAKGVALANAAARAGGDTAEFSPTQLLRSSQQVSGGTRSRAFLRGEGLLQDYAQSGMSLVDRLPNSGTTDRMLTGQALLGGGAGLLHAVNPTTAIGAGVLSLPYAPIVRNASTALLAPRNSARLNTLGALIRSNAQIPGAFGAGEFLQLAGTGNGN